MTGPENWAVEVAVVEAEDAPDEVAMCGPEREEAVDGDDGGDAGDEPLLLRVGSRILMVLWCREHRKFQHQRQH